MTFEGNFQYNQQKAITDKEREKDEEPTIDELLAQQRAIMNKKLRPDNPEEDKKRKKEPELV